jgi:hypothetical protein
MPERRTINDAANHTKGVLSADTAPPVAGQPVTGDYTGTTDEIIEWVACKWGIDEDVVRAQMAKESWWHMDNKGDMSTDQNVCHPEFRTTSGPCPESIGIAQVRYQYHMSAFVNDNAINSTAYNMDYTYSVWRACFNGEYTWLNTVDRGATYEPGDLWGCVGLWFAGRWHTDPAEEYITAVKDNLDRRVWEAGDFQGG